MVDQTDHMIEYPGELGITYIFGQLYHTPVSIMWFRISGFANGDHVDLTPWFQCVYSVHATRNSDAGGGNDTFSIQISGTYPANCGPVLIFHDPTADVIYDFEVIGHKQEQGTGFAGNV